MPLFPAHLGCRALTGTGSIPTCRAGWLLRAGSVGSQPQSPTSILQSVSLPGLHFSSQQAVQGAQGRRWPLGPLASWGSRLSPSPLLSLQSCQGVPSGGKTRDCLCCPHPLCVHTHTRARASRHACTHEPVHIHSQTDIVHALCTLSSALVSNFGPLVCLAMVVSLVGASLSVDCRGVPSLSPSLLGTGWGHQANS